MKTIPGLITISRPTSSSGEEWIEVSLRSQTSRTTFAKFRMDLSAFAKALTGLAYVEGTLELIDDLSVVTKVHEHKYEVVQVAVTAYGPDFEAKAMEKVTALEVDGWRAHRADVKNHHNWVRPNGVRVSFHRYVDKEPEHERAT